ncbi:uncharacterized protein L201_000610 [Kwoniella dendrophila CBS 6074]|uniref:PHD-type domain-containing protein n=1 Tax=Kwoniella dendrophila CBS 6074 TaxID=1295534 RepID=A0AAX4JLH8_9TREE
MHSTHSHGQELMTDWTPSLSNFGSGARRDKESFSNDHRAVASPTYSHLSAAESQTHSPAAQSSPYIHGQTLVINGPAPSYHLPYPTLSGSHLQPMSVQPSPRLSPLGQSSTYGPTSQGDYEVFQTPSRSNPSGSQVSPEPYHDQSSFTPQQSTGYDGATPLLTTTTLTRSYDSTIPSYYQTLTDGKRAWSQATPDKQLTVTKRKREKKDKETPPSGKELKTPKRGKQKQQQQSEESSGGRASKRVRVESAPTTSVHLPTPPSSGKEVPTIHLPPHLRLPIPTTEEIMTPIEEEPELIDPSTRRGLVITRHQEEGRKLGLLGISQGEPEDTKSPDEQHLSPRTTTIPALTTDASGLASLATNEVLESEVAWFENRTRGHQSPPSSPDLVTLRTPIMNQNQFIPDDEEDTPEVQAQKIAKRLEAFSEHTIKEDQPLISTRIDLFGRVAVRKATAIKFLGLDRSTQLVEETKDEDEEDWIEKPVASSSKVVLKPLWPDEEAPWALAGGSKKERLRREENEKATLLKRYLETASDDSGSDEEGLMTMYTTYGKGKGKSISRLVSSSTSSSTGTSTDQDRDSTNRGGRSKNVSPDGSNANARSALIISLRNRVLPLLPAGVVACVCGTNNTNGMGSMISCAACKTWHHIICCGIEDESKIGPNWWCTSCENSSRSVITTPSSHHGGRGYGHNHNVHTTPRGRYSQLADPRSSAVKSDIGHIALAPSPMFVTSVNHGFGLPSTRTPISRIVSSPKRPERARMLSYDGSNDLWSQYTNHNLDNNDNETEDNNSSNSNGPPSTPAPIMNSHRSNSHSRSNTNDKFSTPRIDDTPFDVTSTPSRHLDFNFGQPSLFSLTPLGGRSRVPSSMLVENTPIRGISIARNISFSGPGPILSGFSASINNNLESVPMSFPHNSNSNNNSGHSRSDYLKDLSRSTPGSSTRDENFPPVSPRWPVGLLGAHNLSPSPFGNSHDRKSSLNGSSNGGGGGGHKRNLSGNNKLSSMRSSSRSGLPISANTQSGISGGTDLIHEEKDEE